MKTAYDHDMTQPMGASYMPKNTTTSEQPLTSGGMSSSFPSTSTDDSNSYGGSYFTDGPFNEQRVMAYRSGVDAARHHFGVKHSNLVQPGTPKTNVDMVVAKKPNAPNIPDAGTGYATSGAQYGADIRK